MPRNPRQPARSPFLVGAYVVPERAEGQSGFPFTLFFVPMLDMVLDERVTIFVGENGSGKSTLVEALAELVGLPWDGGSGNELADSERTEGRRLASFMRPRIRARPPNKYFFRAEALGDFGRLLEARERDPDFLGDPYNLYGGRTIRERSHGEAVGALLASRARPGLYLMDEPEAALSPARQQQLVVLINERVATGTHQFVIATHSPILMTVKGARIVSLDGPGLREITKEETTHWKTYAALFGGVPT